jgi:hypothetical protein
MTETGCAELPKRVDASLRALEVELERRRMDIAVLEMKAEALRLLRELAVQQSGAGEAAEARAGSSPWFQEVLAAVWTAF